MKPFILLMLVLLFAVCAELYISNTKLQITHFKVTFSECPNAFDGYKIVQLSDLHSKQFGKDNTRLIESVQVLKPDIIVMTGDMADRTDKNFKVFIRLAESLVKICPVYYVTGNHEQGMDIQILSKIKMQLELFGVHVLEDERVIIEKGRDTLSLYGYSLPLSFYRGGSDPNRKTEAFSAALMQDALGRADGSNVNILLTHNPRYFKTYCEWGADLTLSGHIHGGMIRIPFIGAVFSPDIEFFPQYGGGLYKSGQNFLVVNRGLGNGRIGFRFFNRPEITAILLRNI